MATAGGLQQRGPGPVPRGQRAKAVLGLELGRGVGRVAGHVVLLAVVFAMGAAVLVGLARRLPSTDADTDADPHAELKFPNSVEDLQALAATLHRYERAHPVEVAALFGAAYLFKQTFAIPGSVFMNLLAGSLYGWAGFPAVCVLNTVGATACYLLAGALGRDLLEWAVPDRVHTFQAQVTAHAARGGLFFELVSLRMFPMTPHWLVNMASPVVGVPIPVFAAAVFIGMMPYNFVTVQAGQVLAELTSVWDVLTVAMLVRLTALALVAQVPPWLVRRRQAPSM